jgi:hypothetical protein
MSRLDLPDENRMYFWFSVVLIFLGGLILLAAISALKNRRPVTHFK